MITRSDYMNDSEKLHHPYYLQFATTDTERFVRERIGLAKLATSKDKYFNDLGIKHTRNGAGTWIWDFAPVNEALIRQAGETVSHATHTCVAKACARHLLEQMASA